jgi:NADH dehydrogenase FAD-containing subunit
MYRASYNLFDHLQALFTTGSHSPSDQPLPSKPSVLVVGYGWGGKAFCDNIDRTKYDVHILTDKPFFLNNPKMIESVVTWDNSIVQKKITGPNVHFGTCQKILPGHVEATFDNNNMSPDDSPHKLVPYYKFNLNYDYLVLAVGSVPNTFGIQGADTSRFLKNFNDVRLLRHELADNKDVIVNIIGGGPTGVELALALTKDGRGVRLIEAAPSILNGFSDETKKAVCKELKKYKVDLKLNTKVTNIEEKFIVTPDDKSFDRGITVWTSGVKQPPLIDAFTGGRRLGVDKFLKTDGHHNIYAIGDINGSGPPTAQNAKAQGIFLAEHFNGGFNETRNGYKYIEKGRIIHGADAIHLEYSGSLWQVPKIFGFIVDYFTAP